MLELSRSWRCGDYARIGRKNKPSTTKDTKVYEENLLNQLLRALRGCRFLIVLLCGLGKYDYRMSQPILALCRHAHRSRGRRQREDNRCVAGGIRGDDATGERSCAGREQNRAAGSAAARLPGIERDREI